MLIKVFSVTMKYMRRLKYAIVAFLVVGLVVFYYFYQKPKPLEKPVIAKTSKRLAPSPTSFVSKGAFQQASRMPLQQQENPPQPINLEGLDEMPSVETYFHEQYPANGWRILKNSAGQVTSIIPEDGGSISAAQYGGNVLAWAKHIAPLFGATADQLNSSETQETNFQMVYHIQQTVEGYEVYNGGLQVFVRQSDKAIFNLNNSLKQVASFDSEERVSREAAWNFLTQQFENPIERIDGTYANPTEKQIYAEDPNKQPELAWIFDIRVNNTEEYLTRRVLVGSSSGNILVSEPTSVH